MADVTGPISTLPGAERTPPEGTMCDEHFDRAAYKRVQGETDSFGCEMADMCKECYDSYRAELGTADNSGVCDWCKTRQPRVRFHRDFEEGSCGPVYEVCDGCIAKENERLQEELDDSDWYD